MTGRDTVRSKSAALAVRLHFLFEALRLNLLPQPLAESVGRLAAAVEEGRGVGRQVREARTAFLDHREGMGLADLAWPRVGGEAEASAAARALSRCDGEAVPRAAAERLGRFCEEVVHQPRGRKSSGSYYTPWWIADEIANTMVAGVLAGRRQREALSLRVLDPAVDRLYILAALVALGARGVVPWWAVAALVGRDAVLAACLVVLRRRGYAPFCVTYLGKAATFLLLYAFPLLLLGSGAGPAAAVARPLGYAFAVWGVGLYLYSGLLYLAQFALALRTPVPPRAPTVTP